MYPTSCTSPKIYGLPKIHKTSTPIRPTVSSRGVVTYGVAKVLTRVLKPLIGKSPHHIQSTRDFVNRFRKVTLLPGECLNLHDVSAFFTSVPLDPALKNYQRSIGTGWYFVWQVCIVSTEHHWTSGVLPAQHILLFSKQILQAGERSGHGVTSQPYSCQPVHGAFWKGSPQVCLQPPRFWFRFVGDNFVIQQQAHKQLFPDHINSIDPAIKFTVKGNHENGAIPFLDILVKPEADNSLSITVYIKPTHTDQYLQWDSHHNLSAKYMVIGTLTHRPKTVCTVPVLLNEELQHLMEALVRSKYPRWAINKIQNKFINNNQEGDGNNNNQVDNTTQAGKNSGNSTEDKTPQGKSQCRT